MTDMSKVHIHSKRYKDGYVIYKLLVDGRYWVANEWEYQCIEQGHTPEELGMYPFTDEDLDNE